MKGMISGCHTATIALNGQRPAKKKYMLLTFFRVWYDAASNFKETT
jgi:hypothetical protein